MQPHLVRWDRSYGERGLTILYVAYGPRVTPASVRGVMRADGAAFPVLHDANGTWTDTYQVRAYPTAYVIGRDGRVAWQGIPHFDPSSPEAAIRGALEAR